MRSFKKLEVSGSKGRNKGSNGVNTALLQGSGYSPGDGAVLAFMARDLA